jgi:hypothetical protein
MEMMSEQYAIMISLGQSTKKEMDEEVPIGVTIKSEGDEVSA